MTKHSKAPILRRRIAAIVVAGGAAVWFTPVVASAEAGSPFANFEGKWQGTGEVIGADGKSESIRCRGTFELSDNGGSLTQNLVCASASYRIQVNSYAVATGQDVKGYWSEATRQVQGNLTGHIVDGAFEGTVAGATFSAQLSLKATPTKQSIDIKPQGANVSEVKVTLTHDG